jgi:hypothetical protein
VGEALTDRGWSWDYVMDLPAATAFALHAAMRKRHGCKFGGPDYAERDEIERMRQDGMI